MTESSRASAQDGHNTHAEIVTTAQNAGDPVRQALALAAAGDGAGAAAGRARHSPTRSSRRSAATVPPYARPLEGAFGQAMRAGRGALAHRLPRRGRGQAARARGGRARHLRRRSAAARRGRAAPWSTCSPPTGSVRAWRGGGPPSAAARAGSTPTRSRCWPRHSSPISTSSRRARREGYAEEQSAIAGEAARLPAAAGGPAGPVARRSSGPRSRPPPATPAGSCPRRWPPSCGATRVERPVARACRSAPWRRRSRTGLICALVADPDGPGRRAELEGALGERPAALGHTVPSARGVAERRPRTGDAAPGGRGGGGGRTARALPRTTSPT